jgi:hypothetical protein
MISWAWRRQARGLLFFSRGHQLQKVPAHPTTPPLPRLTEAEKQALLAPRLERRRAQFAAEEAVAQARAEKDVAARPLEPWEPWFFVEDDLDYGFSGCGAACDCCDYLRAECAAGVQVVWEGAQFMVIDFLSGRVIGEADPGYKPLPEDSEADPGSAARLTQTGSDARRYCSATPTSAAYEKSTILDAKPRISMQGQTLANIPICG